jgi:antitoxin MazE
MTNTVAVNNWGGSVGIRIPAKVAKKFNLKAGDTLTINNNDSEIVLTPEPFHYTTEWLVQGMNPDDMKGEVFGEAVGNEIF